MGKAKECRGGRGPGAPLPDIGVKSAQFSRNVGRRGKPVAFSAPSESTSNPDFTMPSPRFLFAFLLCPTLHAADPAPPVTVLSLTDGEPVFVDSLSTAPAKPVWSAAKGAWMVEDGHWKGAEVPADKHGAVVRHTRPLGDFVLRYEVRLDGAKGTSLSVNAPAGHLSRVSVGPHGLQARKDDLDHDGPDQGVAFPALPVEIKPGEWHTVVMEMCGDTLLASLDGKPVSFGRHEAFTTAKSNFGFTVSGESAAFRNVSVWNAKPNPAWPERREALAHALPPAPQSKRQGKPTS